LVLTRRRFLTAGLAGTAGLLSLGGYAVAVEPGFRPILTRHDLALPGWPADRPPLRIAFLADLHAVDPWMPIARVEEIVAQTNGLGADLILLLGDYMSNIHPRRRRIGPKEIARALAGLKAPLGVHGVLGNHDYMGRGDPVPVTSAFEAAGIDMLLNRAVRIDSAGHRFWLSGTESMHAIHRGPTTWGGRDDIAAALAGIDDDLPIVHMAHEPYLFRRVPKRVMLTLSGHTHGGQIGIPGVGRLVGMRGPTKNPWIRGHYEVDGRHLVVSSGLGMSNVPVRFLVPPEINLVEIRSPATT
jgi:predicted MPP superfamily phosphohydrolase